MRTRGSLLVSSIGGKDGAEPSSNRSVRLLAMPTPIEIAGLTKRFDETVAVDNVSLAVAAGEMFFLLGPSGCGKTTLLRMIAGFNEPSAGAIRFGERDVTRLSPEKRNAGMVFQSYALWPHMTVEENVEFGLKARKTPRDERKRRVAEALDLVRMGPLARRKPGQLSGGQQQRVALARALVVRPDVLLLDEPLSNLDAKLRGEMREEIRRVCRAVGITTVYVTHDQKEALSLADRMAVMSAGSVLQIGPPREMYERPRTKFVAEFLGPANLLPATIRDGSGGGCVAETPAGALRATPTPTGDRPNGASLVMIRPESFRIGRSGERLVADNLLQGIVRESIYFGEMAQHAISVRAESASPLVLDVFELGPRGDLSPGDRVTLAVAADKAIVLSGL